MKNKLAVACVVCMSYMGLRYCWLTFQGAIQPVLATWILFCVATSLSLWTYWSSEKHDLISNIGNTIDTILVNIVLVVMLVFGQSIRMGFNLFEVACLAACGVILIAWRYTKRHMISNLALQTVMTVAYFPTIYALWYATTNTEPIGAWTVAWLGCVLALTIAIMSRDKLAAMYATRATVLVSIMLALMVRLEWH